MDGLGRMRVGGSRPLIQVYSLLAIVPKIGQVSFEIEVAVVLQRG